MALRVLARAGSGTMSFAPSTCRMPRGQFQGRLLRACCERPRRRAADERDEVASPHGRASSGLGSHFTTPLRKNAAVHHSKNCALMSQMSFASIRPRQPPIATVERTSSIGGFVPCMDGARGAREKNLTFPRIVRVQPCIRPLNAAVLAAGPDVIR